MAAFWFQQTEGINDLDPAQFIMLASISMNDIGWESSIIDAHTLEGRTKMSLFNLGQKITVTIKDGLATIKSESSHTQIWDGEKDQRNTEHLIEYIRLNQKIYNAESLQADFDSAITGDLSSNEKIVRSNGKNYGTYGLIGINTLVFLIMSVSTHSFLHPSLTDIFHWGGNARLYTFGGQWWRLLTSVFLHFGFVHLFMNMCVLFFIGHYLEPVLGTGKFLLTFLCTGVLASLLSILWAGYRISGGASGAIFGLFGCFLALLITGIISGRIRMILLQSLFIFIAIFLLNGMQQGVDNAAHIGGLFSGILFGYILSLGINNTKRQKFSSASITLITLFVTVYFLIDRKTDRIHFEDILQKIAVLESKALQTRTGSRQKSKQVRIKELMTIEGPSWQECKRLLAGAEGYTFGKNKSLQQQKELLARYIDARIIEQQILLSSISKDIHDSNEIDSIRIAISDKIDSLRVNGRKL